MNVNLYLYMHELSEQFGVFAFLASEIFLNPFIKNVPPVIIYWVLWFSPNDNIAIKRQKLIITLFVAVSAIFLGRVTNMVLPFKLRPMYDAAVTQNPVVNPVLSEWSAFPSDHAVLFFSLAACFLLINRFAGSLALLHAVFIVSIPRILYGFHWPSDILGGAIIGVTVALISMNFATRYFDRTRLYTLARGRPLILYPTLIFLTMQIATMFVTMRMVASTILSLFA